MSGGGCSAVGLRDPTVGEYGHFFEPGHRAAPGKVDEHNVKPCFVSANGQNQLFAVGRPDRAPPDEAPVRKEALLQLLYGLKTRAVRVHHQERRPTRRVVGDPFSIRRPGGAEPFAKDLQFSGCEREQWRSTVLIAQDRRLAQTLIFIIGVCNTRLQRRNDADGFGSPTDRPGTVIGGGVSAPRLQ